MGKVTFEAPTRASASHLIHLIGIDCFREELAKLQKANADGILEVIASTTIRRKTPPTHKEQKIMDAALARHQSGEMNDLVWAQIRTLYVYIGAIKDDRGYLVKESLQYPEGWKSSQDLCFAKRLLPHFLNYQLQDLPELKTSIDNRMVEAQTMTTEDLHLELSEEQNRIRNEQTHWERIRNSNDPEDFQTFLQLYKGGAYERLATVAQEELLWNDVSSGLSYSGLEAFLNDFPYGLHAEEANALLALMNPNTGGPHTIRLVFYRLKRFIGHQIHNAHFGIRKLFFAGLHVPDSDQEEEAQFFTPLNLLKSPTIWFAAIVLTMTGVAVGNFTKPKPEQEVTPQLHTQLVKTFKGHTKSLKSVAFLPNSTLAISGSEDTTLKLWNITSGKEIRTFRGHTGIIYSVAASSNGEKALSGSHDNTVNLWNLKTGKLIHTLRGHKNPVVSVAFSKDGKLALSGSHDKTIKLWNVTTGKLVRTFYGHEDWVISVTFVSGAKGVLSASHDTTLRLWDARTGKNIRTFRGHRDWITSVSTSKFSHTAISSSYDNTVRKWNMKTGKEISSFDNHGASIINSLTFSPDEKMILSSSQGTDKAIILWDARSGKKIKTLSTPNTTKANAVSFSQDGSHALSAGEDKTLILWRLQALLPQTP